MLCHCTPSQIVEDYIHSVACVELKTSAFFLAEVFMHNLDRQL